ncbi:MAG TPA: sigma-70 family RNA polymerase sigma factor [Kofleriaceae bacterium]|nr:sigma-70 family RNA polymerase sigma factor [Kofleriaceae bacterium]
MDPGLERELVARLRRGDGDAFDAIYGAYRGPVYGFLARMSGRRDLAEELLQETFVRLGARATGLAEDTRVGAWLFTVARNLHVSHVRMTMLDAARVDRAALEEQPRTATPFEEVSAGQTRARLEEALARLPETYREVLLLVAVERMEPSEAAAVVGVTAETLRQRLSRARTMMRDALADAPARAAGGSKR